ncbi:MAG: MotA/TolQ/ExbB proton channel family protein [Candidatus Hydrogenedentes bacterium]|nr:MotA/TolQ/ExbB proton channel family protein [Candidatus Hydrogenedentota bacterium]
MSLTDYGFTSPMDIMEKGGVLMWPILATSVVALAIALERFWSLRRATLDTREFMDAMRGTLRQNRIQEAIGMCEEADAPVARIIRAGLLKHDRGKDEIREAIENAGQLEIPRLERFLAALATCVNIAPLLGLLGTVQGMILCFARIMQRQGQVVPADLAEGIQNALLTTAFGLTVAIPAMIAHNYFITRVEGMILEMEVSSTELLDILTQTRGERDV